MLRRRTSIAWPHAGPEALPRNWRALVNRVQSEAELTAIEDSIRRGARYGEASWQRLAARRLGLQSTLSPGGRPLNKLNFPFVLRPLFSDSAIRS